MKEEAMQQGRHALALHDCLPLLTSSFLPPWSEIVVTDRQTKKQIMKLEEELPVWQMALEIKSIPGEYSFQC